jgi:hypothetical protein
MAAAAPDWGFPSALEDVSGEVAIVGVAEADHTKASGRTPKEIAAQAIERALADAGLAPRDVDGPLCTAPFDGRQFTADDYRAYFGVTHDLWESTAGGGMVWAGSAPHEAALAIRAGKARVILNVFAVAWATERAEMVGGRRYGATGGAVRRDRDEVGRIPPLWGPRSSASTSRRSSRTSSSFSFSARGGSGRRAAWSGVTTARRTARSHSEPR